jgi:amino acid transporter
VASVVVASVVGMLFLIALTVAIPNIKAASNTESAVALITRLQLGVGVQKVVLVAIMFSFFAAGVVTMATGARLVYAMSRDARFPGHQVMRRVNPRTQTPIPATILMFAGGVVLMVAVPGNALIQLITAGSVLIVVIYGATVVLYLAVRKGLDRKEGAFSLGRFELPVAISALVWMVAAFVVLVSPASAHVPDAVAAGLAAAGGVFFLGMLKFNRKVLDVEPAADLLEH